MSQQSPSFVGRVSPVYQRGGKGESKGRRTSGALREENLAKGAFLIEFQEPSEPVNMFRRHMLPADMPVLLKGSEWQSAKDKYRTMERKGFRVTKDIGCLIPHEQFGTTQQGATLKGYQRAFTFFARWCPKFEPSGVVKRNEFGWPATVQISHLCHRRSCCRIDHLIAEEQWRNVKRNYCGFYDECDCGSSVECLRRYQMQEQAESPVFCETKEEVLEALDGTACLFTVHGADRHKQRDAKSEKRLNQKARKRASEKHAHQTERKQSRLAPVAEAEEDTDDDSDDFQ